MKDRPDIAEVEAAVRTLLRWAGDDPAREGLVDTPNRVARAYREFFSGYAQDPQAVLSATFEEAGDYDDMVLVRNIRFESHCEHHLVPIVGFAHIAYLPGKRVVGLSKLARVVDLYADADAHAAAEQKAWERMMTVRDRADAAAAV